MPSTLTSRRSPYLTLSVHVNGQVRRFEALLDTGFDGEIVVPEDSPLVAGRPDKYASTMLADGSLSLHAAFRGHVDLPPLGSYQVQVIALGDECLIGRGVSDRFRVTFDHGQTLTIEP